MPVFKIVQASNENNTSEDDDDYDNDNDEINRDSKMLIK